MSIKIALERIQSCQKNSDTLLDLSKLQLKEIPLEISKLTQLTSLNLSRNQLTDTKGLKALTELTSLGLGDNELTEIKGLETLTQLTHLYLNDNQLTEIKGMETLKQITALFLGNNRLTEIKGLEALTQLTTLHLHNNQFTEIKGLETLTQLTALHLFGNLLSEIKGLEALMQLNSLNLGSNHLTNIKGLKTQTQVTELNLTRNQLTEIKGLEALTKLTGLYFWDNQIKEIKNLETLTHLTTLDLGSNQLTEIRDLVTLTQLTTLNLAVNQLSEIKGLETLRHLTSLNLGSNQLTEIGGLEALTQLTTLYLGGNQLKEIKGLETLTKLTTLYLADNQLTEIPEILLTLNLPILWKTGSKEDGIFVQDNPITNPPPGIIESGNEAIKEYFKQKKKSGEALLLEAKLILLGDGRSGKTSLANRLLGKDLPSESDRTQGVDIIIGKYSFSQGDGNEFKLNIWDFAGQDKYKTLHQLFYTESSVYVLVAESGNTGTDFDDWLQTAALFGEGSPLIVVLNEFKAGIGMGSFDVKYWKMQFPDLLKEVFTVNLLTKNNFSNVEDYIHLLAKTLPHTKYPFPSNWAAIRKVLNDRRNEQYISLKEYLEICSQNNLPERDSALILSSVLHKIGDCLHYQQSDLLKQIIILNNKWATDAVYKILDDKIIVEEKSGFFDQDDTIRIWKSDDYIDMRPQLVELMQQFKLAYKLPGKKEYVTPPLLPQSKPESFTWPESESLELYIEYEFLPKALLTQFVVSRHADIANGRTLVWRHGVVLEWPEEALAEVSKTKLEGRDAIFIKSQGTNRKGMMTVILKTFRELQGEYKGIKYKEKVPCNCEGCKTGQNRQHYFDLAHLQRKIDKESFDGECLESLETINVLKLLENTFVFENIQQGKPIALKEDISGERISETRVLKIFLASSKELEPERKKIEQTISRKNNELRKQGIFIELLIWENNFISKSFRSQDNYNLAVGECDFFVMLFYSKVGKYSSEEFEKAYSRFEKGGFPRFRLYQKYVDLPKEQNDDDTYSRIDFLKKLKALDHFPEKFPNEDALSNDLEKYIDELLRDDKFVQRLEVE